MQNLSSSVRPGSRVLIFMQHQEIAFEVASCVFAMFCNL